MRPLLAVTTLSPRRTQRTRRTRIMISFRTSHQPHHRRGASRFTPHSVPDCSKAPIDACLHLRTRNELACISSTKSASRSFTTASRSRLATGSISLSKIASSSKSKSVEKLLPVHVAQLLSYLKLSGHPARSSDQLQRSPSASRNSSGRQRVLASMRVEPMPSVSFVSSVVNCELQAAQLPSSTKSTPSRPMFRNLS